ncbi:MAG: flagellar biosynthesis protein FliQ [Deltaproteobacteria bacterium]|nr:flagellar biosynthesis protein FliQ [Deltaproteobacteria bacterium]
MGSDQLVQVVREGLFLVLLVSAPPLAASLVVGLLMSLLQATTQLQDQTLSFVPKLAVVLVSLAITGPWMGAQLVRFTEALFRLLPALR